MRLLLSILFLNFVSLTVTNGQGVKPTIVGQKDLSTSQGQSITIQLSDLYVEEEEQEGDHEQSPGSGDEGNNDGGDSGEGTDGDGDGDNDGGDGGADDGESDDNDDNQEEDDNDDDPAGGDGDGGGNNGNGESGNGNNKDEKDKDKGKDDDKDNGEEKDKDKDKDKDGDKDKGKGKDKDKGKGKGKGNRTLSYPEGYVLDIFSGPNYTVTGATVTPASDFRGSLSVDIRVKNQHHASPTYALRITVRAGAEVTNTPPKITGQVPVAVSVNQQVEIQFSYLLVADPDNTYPSGFTLNVFAGEHYSVTGKTITPDQDFVGDLTVNVSVHDGHSNSEPYPLKIKVFAVHNTKPIITGQSGLKIPEGETVTLEFSHLVVEDPDNDYPEDFSMQVSEGEHHTVSNYTIRPIAGFRGMLSVPVTVYDGTTSSDPFNVQVQVVAKDRLEIIGQESLEVAEDSAILVDLSDLRVNDPTGAYPTGFTLETRDGENYTIVNGQVRPDLNFAGNLAVPVTVANAGATSAPFPMLVVVSAVNDAPEIENIDTVPLNLTGQGPWPLFPTADVLDVDDDDLLFAEIGFDMETYHHGMDEILYESSPGIHSVFDSESGILFLVGEAKKEAYQRLIRSVRYNQRHADDSVGSGRGRTVYIKVNDGKTSSRVYERQLIVASGIEVEIPSAFTPNNDHANDTWQITLQQEVDQLSAFIRVYDKRGNLVFESNDLNDPWDGRHNGMPLPADVYFFTIDVDLFYRKVSYKGVVAILR